ncbi:MAG: hypothetical protein Q8R53_01375 [Nanoarchaeota archaeon]|nr:hypothetical protein [Nanoarchaeota archaeon]
METPLQKLIERTVTNGLGYYDFPDYGFLFSQDRFRKYISEVELPLELRVHLGVKDFRALVTASVTMSPLDQCRAYLNFLSEALVHDKKSRKENRGRKRKSYSSDSSLEILFAMGERFLGNLFSEEKVRQELERWGVKVYEGTFGKKISERTLAVYIDRHHYYNEKTEEWQDFTDKVVLLEEVVESAKVEQSQSTPYFFRSFDLHDALKTALEKKARHNYTFTEVLKTPFASVVSEFRDDYNPPTPFSGGKWRRRCKHIGTILGSFGITAVPHELIHAGVNSATGGVNKEIVINTLYGGPLWEQLIPGIESKVLVPFIGGYVDPEPASRLAEFAMTVAPYSLTPLGLYLVMKSKEKKSFPLWACGIGALTAHEGGIIGDWFHAGRMVATEATELVYHTMGIEKNIDDSSFESFLVSIAGFYIGAKMLSFTYRAMKGAINSIRTHFSQPERALSNNSGDLS